VLYGRFFIVELICDCMAPDVFDSFEIVDTKAEIRSGDLFSFSTTDHAQLGVSDATSEMAKHFLGVDLEPFLECEGTNPPRIVQTCLSNLLRAHQAVATAPTFAVAKRLLKASRHASGSPLMIAFG
jgi:hypothetical protein